MIKKATILLALGLIFSLAACSSAQPVQQAAVADSQNQPANSSGGGSGAPQRNSGQSQLAVDILRLEGTNQAVTADEAKQLLPLWEKVKTMSADSSTAPADLQAVYTQISQVLTSDQTQAIQQMTFDQTTMQALMQQYGIQVTPGAGGGGNFPTLSPDQQATRTARQQTQQAGGSGPAGNGTPGANGFGNRGGRGFGMVFVDPLIKLLQTRAGG
jgi:hypothetical protein